MKRKVYDDNNYHINNNDKSNNINDDGDDDLFADMHDLQSIYKDALPYIYTPFTIQKFNVTDYK